MSVTTSSILVNDQEKRIETEISQLIQDIQRIDPSGEDHCSYGDLFTDPFVEQYYEALLGTLKAAKRKGLVKFKGQILLKGIHDDVLVHVQEKDDGVNNEPTTNHHRQNEVDDEEEVQVVEQDTNIETKKKYLVEIASNPSSNILEGIKFEDTNTGINGLDQSCTNNKDKCISTTNESLEDIIVPNETNKETTGGLVLGEMIPKSSSNSRKDVRSKENDAPSDEDISLKETVESNHSRISPNKISIFHPENNQQTDDKGVSLDCFSKQSKLSKKLGNDKKKKSLQSLSNKFNRDDTSIVTAPVQSIIKSSNTTTRRSYPISKRDLFHSSTTGTLMSSVSKTPPTTRRTHTNESHLNRIERECQQLLIDIRRIEPEMDPVCSFGDLFSDEDVQQYYEALVGTLKAAKRKGMINFEAEILFKGMHDHIQISIVE